MKIRVRLQGNTILVILTEREVSLINFVSCIKRSFLKRELRIAIKSVLVRYRKKLLRKEGNYDLGR